MELAEGQLVFIDGEFGRIKKVKGDRMSVQFIVNGVIKTIELDVNRLKVPDDSKYQYWEYTKV